MLKGLQIIGNLSNPYLTSRLSAQHCHVRSSVARETYRHLVATPKRHYGSQMSRLLDLLGSDVPLIQAPMAGPQDSRMAIAVCGAGALGSLPAALMSMPSLRSELAAMRSCSRPYNVNFFCHQTPSIDTVREDGWRRALAPYFAEYKTEPARVIGGGAARRPFDADAAAIVEEFRPRVVSFHFGLPQRDLLARVRATGAKILSSATTVEEAVWLESCGVDAVIAQGLEAGGHRGHFLSHDLTHQLGTFALVPQIAAAVRVPVIAAGGIADQPGILAALALGAAGVQIGTSYLLCNESLVSQVHRAALKTDTPTALTNLITGRPARGIINRLMRELGPVSELPPDFPLASAALAPLRAAAERAGRGDFSPLWSGQNRRGCAEIGAAELTTRLSEAFR